MHAGTIGHEPRRIGNGRHFDHRLRAVDEFDQHAGIHVAPSRFIHIGVGRRIDIERIVLALAGGDDRIAEAQDEIDELHAGARLIAGPQRIDNPEPLGLALQISADGDVGLDIHHHQMLAMLHGHQVEIGGYTGLSRRVDDDVDQRIGDQHLVRGDGDPAALDRPADLGGGVGFGGHRIVAIGNANRIASRVRAARGDGRNRNARHQHALRHQVRAHLARADDANAHGTALGGAPGEIAGQPGQGNICHTRTSMLCLSPQYRERSPFANKTSSTWQFPVHAMQNRSRFFAPIGSLRCVTGSSPGKADFPREEKWRELTPKSEIVPARWRWLLVPSRESFCGPAIR